MNRRELLRSAAIAPFILRATLPDAGTPTSAHVAADAELPHGALTNLTLHGNYPGDLREAPTGTYPGDPREN